MEYIISEEELKSFAYTQNELFRARQLLKSKQPVELVAEGEVYDTSCEYSGGFHIGKGWGNEDTDFDLGDIMKYEGQNIKIYIQKVKE